MLSGGVVTGIAIPRTSSLCSLALKEGMSLAIVGSWRSALEKAIVEMLTSYSWSEPRPTLGSGGMSWFTHNGDLSDWEQRSRL